MGRAKGSRNKPKENGIGHNGGEQLDVAPTELTDDQKAHLWFTAKKRIIARKAMIASETGELRNEYKRLKADIGMLKSDVDFALSLEDDDAIETHRRRMTIARWEQHPIGLQADMFDNPDRTPSIDKAYAEGKKAGLAGDPCNPPHHPSTEQYQRFVEGFHEGNAVLARGIKPTEGHKLAHDIRDDFSKENEPWPDDAQVGTEAATAGPGE